MIVNNKVIIEIKSVDALAPIHTAQLLTYLKLKELKLGLLINFNSVKLIDGLKRIANNLKLCELCAFAVNIFPVKLQTYHRKHIK